MPLWTEALSLARFSATTRGRSVCLCSVCTPCPHTGESLARVLSVPAGGVFPGLVCDVQPALSTHLDVGFMGKPWGERLGG